MRGRQPQMPQIVRISGAFELPKFSSKYSFVSNRKESKGRNISQNISMSKNEGKEVMKLSNRFNRQRYSQVNPSSQIPQQVRRLRNSENLSTNNMKSKTSKDRLSENPRGQVTPVQNKRIISLSTKSVSRKVQLRQLRQSEELKQICQSQQIRTNMHGALKLAIQNNRTQIHQTAKKIREVRMRRQRRSDVVNTKKVFSRCSQRPKTPLEQKSPQEEKVDQISEEIVDLSYLMLIESILANVCQDMKNGSSELYELCLCYITIDKCEQQKLICNLFPQQLQGARIKELLTLQRLVTYLLVYFQRTKLKRKQGLSGLWDLAVNTFKSHSIMADLILEILQEANKINKKKYKVKQIGKENKIKHITKLIISIRKRLSSILDSKEDKMLELINSLFINSTKIQSLQYINTIDKILKWELLKLPTCPYLPTSVKQHSLILDLDQTLIHFDPKSMKLLIRPYAQEFILRMSKLFEITIFTAGTKQYADELIDEIDPTHCVSFRLYRNHINIYQGAPVKDLSQLGRDLKSTVIVDNTADNFKLQPENGILISSWYGDLQDTALHKLQNTLRNIVKLYPYDLTEGIKRWAAYIKEHIAFSALIYQLTEEI